MCQLFYFRPVAPRQGILSEPWEPQQGGCWVCLASARPAAALGPLQPPGETPGETPRVGSLAHPHEGHPSPGLCVPPRMFPSCDPTGLLDLSPRKQSADMKPWQRPKLAAEGSRRLWELDRWRLVGGRGRSPRQEPRSGAGRRVTVGPAMGRSNLRGEEGHAVDSRPRAGRVPALPSTLALGLSEPPSSSSVKIRTVYHHIRGLRRLCL